MGNNTVGWETGREREKNLHKEIYNDRLNVYGGFTTSHRTLGAINEHSINSHMHENTSLQSAKKEETKSFHTQFIQQIVVIHVVHLLFFILTEWNGSSLNRHVQKWGKHGLHMKRASLFYLFIWKMCVLFLGTMCGYKYCIDRLLLK